MATCGVLAAEVDLLWGRGVEREDDFMCLAKLMLRIQRSSTIRNHEFF